VQFDSRSAKLLRAGDHLIVGDAPGLRLVASASVRAWIYRFKSPADGRMRQIKVGEWPAMSVAQAMVEWARLRDARSAGRDVAQERRAARKATPAAPTATPLTVGALVDSYAGQVRRAPKGVAELRRTMSTMLTDADRNRRPEDVTRAVAYDLIQRHAAAPVQARYLRRELGAAWDWAHDAGRLADTVPNWWRQILRGKLASQGKIIKGQHVGVSKRILTPTEVGAVLRHLPHVSRLNAALLTLYLWTGCRGAEIVAMEGREISEIDGVLWWVIPRSKLKMRRHPLAADLPVPLIGRAADIARARIDVHGSGHLFPSAGKSPHIGQKVAGVCVWWHMPDCKLRPGSIRPRWPVTGWSPHDLRRTVRTQLSAMGCPSEVAEAVLGHIDPDPYRRHDYRAERLDWLMRLVAAWEAAAVR
jgi:integrase